MLANHVFWWFMLFYTHLLLLLQPSVMWLSNVIFSNDAKPPPKWILREFDVSRIRPRLAELSHFETFTWQNLPWGYPVWQTKLSALAGHPTCLVNVIQLKLEIIWTGGLPHRNGLPHLPEVPHLHVNKPIKSLIFPSDRWRLRRLIN